MVVNHSMICPLVEKCKKMFLWWTKEELVDYIIENSSCEELVKFIREHENDIEKRRKTKCQ